ncbi:F-box/LRR-repeat protein At3g26922 [Rosa chinensis]|uniref:F-box/LRR-repeat protein At3g26922 n=1 Tax=Rosa chinensis TaxID=74649 RepID=UPI000D094B1B|nr:F-box/LRR-repeat protein At3g26922 [Rosa chinensis]
MDASSRMVQYKKQKLDRAEEMIGGSKSLSNLPDVLIVKILSLLPTKDAIRTSILSKRWEYIWTSLPNLKFIQWKFENKRTLLVNAVERALILRGPADIKEFSLSFEVLGDALRVNTWISAVLQHNVEDLSLVLHSFKDPVSLPRSLFMSATLKVLLLELPCIFKVPSTICFSSLRSLTLSSVVFSDDYSAQQLFSGCSVLEEIFLYGCNWANLNFVSISAPKLLRFTIDEGDSQILRGSDGCQIMVLGVRLAYFSYTGEFLDDYCFYNSSANEALISLNSIKRVQHVSYRLNKLLNGLSSVKHLTICDTSFEVVQTNASEHLMPSFNNLTTLIFERVEVDLGCKGLLAFLQNCPCLKYLIFCEGIGLYSDDAKDDGMLEPLPPCFLNSLEEIDVLEFCGDEDELHAMKVLLKCAMVLKKVTINWCSGVQVEPKTMKDINKQLLDLPRGSGNCKVVCLCAR